MPVRSSAAVGSLEHDVEAAERAEVAELRAKLGRLARRAEAGHGSRAAAAGHTGRAEAARRALQQKEAALSAARRASPAAERPAEEAPQEDPEGGAPPADASWRSRAERVHTGRLTGSSSESDEDDGTPARAQGWAIDAQRQAHLLASPAAPPRPGQRPEPEPEPELAAADSSWLTAAERVAALVRDARAVGEQLRKESAARAGMDRRMRTLEAAMTSDDGELSVFISPFLSGAEQKAEARSVREGAPGRAVAGSIARADPRQRVWRHEKLFE